MRLWLLRAAISLFVLALLSLLALVFVQWRQEVALDQGLRLEEPWLLDVQPGDTPSKVFMRLESEGVLEGAFWLRLHWRLNKAHERLFSGEYPLSPGMPVREMLGLWQRHEVVQHNLTLVEGWTFRQLRTALAAQPKLVQSLEGLTDEAVMQRLGYPGLHPEGRFFPDTYRYIRGMTDLEVLRRAFVRLDSILAEEWEKRAEHLPYETPYQALIMASLIEEETGVPEERSEIAGVFVRRLAQGMLLQTDPTVIYGLGDSYNGNLTRQQLRHPSPYNTYLHRGLPPTPIAMPGREALRAALHPAEGESLYFVARGDGTHIFSNTLEEHNQAVRQYQLNRRADYRSSPAVPGATTAKEPNP